jgi:hypothetical protein
MLTFSRSLLYYGPIYFEACKSFSPVLTGVALFPETFTVAPATVIVGILTAITGRYRWSLWLGWFLTTLGMGLLFLQDEHTPTVGWILLNLLPGLGTGILFAGMGIAIPAAAKPKDMAHAVAFFSFVRAFGQGTGVAVGGVVFQNVLRMKLEGIKGLEGMAVEWSKDAAGLIQTIGGLEGKVREQVVSAYADGLKVVWVTMCGLAGLALVSNLFVKEYSLERELETEQGFVQQGMTSDVKGGE